MTASEYLRRARTLNLEIGAKQRELIGLKMNAQCLHSPLLSERVQSTHQNTSNKASDKVIDLDRIIREEISELVNIKAEIHAKINGLENRIYVSVLTDYYISCMTIEKIAEEENYSVSQVKRYRKEALKDFAFRYGFCKDEPK